MSRLARIILLAALIASLAPPQPAFAAAGPPDRFDAGLITTAQDLLARLWGPVARLFGASDGGPGMDSDGGTAGASDRGPTMDPDGAQDPPPSGGESDGGPTMDPNG